MALGCDKVLFCQTTGEFSEWVVAARAAGAPIGKVGLSHSTAEIYTLPAEHRSNIHMWFLQPEYSLNLIHKGLSLA